MDDGHPLVSRLYDPVMAIPERAFLASHREYLADDLPGATLDIGCGTGAMFPYFAGQDVELYGVEPDPHMRRQAREAAEEHNLDITIADARAESLPYDDNSLDVVVASFVFCTIPDPDAALDEVARVLRPGGEFRFLEHVRGEGYMGCVHDIAAPAWHSVAGGCNLDRETGERFRSHDSFVLVDFTQLSGSVMPMIRGTLRRKPKLGRIRRLMDEIRPRSLL